MHSGSTEEISDGELKVMIVGNKTIFEADMTDGENMEGLKLRESYGVWLHIPFCNMY